MRKAGSPELIAFGRGQCSSTSNSMAADRRSSLPGTEMRRADVRRRSARSRRRPRMMPRGAQPLQSHFRTSCSRLCPGHLRRLSRAALPMAKQCIHAIRCAARNPSTEIRISSFGSSTKSRMLQNKMACGKTTQWRSLDVGASAVVRSRVPKVTFVTQQARYRNRSVFLQL